MTNTINITDRKFAAASILMNQTEMGRDILREAGVLPDAAGGQIPPELVYGFISIMSKQQLKLLRQMARELTVEDLGPMQ
jgi:hypothetical protein